MVAVLACVPSVGRSQSAVPVAGFDDGFFLQSADGQARLVFGLVAQADGKFSTDDSAPFPNTFLIRKMRPTLTGRFGRVFQFKVMPDFGGGTTVIQDAYLDLRISPGFQLRAGKDKTPVGYELLIGDAYLLFPERSLASSLVPNRDVGVEALGELSGGRVSYVAGVFNGMPDGASSTSDADVSNGQDLAGRIVVRPFRRGRGDGALRNLGFHLGGSRGEETAALPSMRTSVGQTWFAYRPGVVADGARRRVTPALFYYRKCFGGFVEYLRSTQRVAQGGTSTDVSNHGWNATASLALTGEAASEKALHPNHPLDPGAGGWGAWQIAARYATVTIDPHAFARALPTVDAAGRARQYALGLNWFPADIVKYYATFEHTSFSEAAGARPSENVIVVRAQLAF